METPAAAESTPSHRASLRDIIGEVTLEDAIERWQLVPVTGPDGRAFDFPPADYVGFIESLPRYSFDGCTASDQHIGAISAYARDIHRHWLTLQQVRERLPSNGHFLDLGAYPFGIPISLRQFASFKGLITASATEVLDETGRRILDGMGISRCAVDLDPHVVDATTEGLTCEIPLADGTVDVALMAHVIEHLYHPMDILREVARVLRPGGTLIVTTNNAQQINVFDSFIAGDPWVFEPAAGTAAMVIDYWRARVRFFTARDVEMMLRAAGFAEVTTSFAHCFYDAFSERFIKDPQPHEQEWKLDIILKHRHFGNELIAAAVR